jgi:hypothetical protein
MQGVPDILDGVLQCLQSKISVSSAGCILPGSWMIGKVQVQLGR